MNIRKEIRGVCRVDCDSKAAMRLMNICSHRDISTWRKKDNDGEFYIYSDNREEIVKVAEKYNMKIDITEMKSLKRFFRNNKKRVSVLVGIFVFMSLIYIESLYIWHIEVDGNGKYTDEEIIEMIDSQYPCMGHRKSQIDMYELRETLSNSLDDVSWVSCSVSGTKLTVRLKEAIDIFDSGDIDEPCNLVASMDCTIYSIVTSAGTPVAVVGDKVKKGDILISGVVNIHNDDSEVVDTRYVTAQGEVYGISKIEYKDTVSSENQKKKTRGKRLKNIQFGIGRKVYTPYDREPADPDYDISSEKYYLHFGNLYLPFSACINKYDYFSLKKETLTERELKRRINERFMRYVGKLQEKGVQIVEKNVIITNGQNEMTAHGNITVRLPVGVPDVIAPVDLHDDAPKDGTD